MFLFCLVFAMFCARLFICALWSPAGKGLTSWLSFVVSSVSLSLSHWYPGSGVVLDCIDSWSLHHYLFLYTIADTENCKYNFGLKMLKQHCIILKSQYFCGDLDYKFKISKTLFLINSKEIIIFHKLIGIMWCVSKIYFFSGLYPREMYHSRETWRYLI